MATVILALAEAVSWAGVKVAVLVSPVPLSVPIVPPVTTISPSIKDVPGSSVKVKVIVAVSPLFSVDLSLVMVAIGRNVSTA